eukprot:363955-Chlamydomonas_euryale.AAC.1
MLASRVRGCQRRAHSPPRGPCADWHRCCCCCQWRLRCGGCRWHLACPVRCRLNAPAEPSGVCPPGSSPSGPLRSSTADRRAAPLAPPPPRRAQRIRAPTAPTAPGCPARLLTQLPFGTTQPGGRQAAAPRQRGHLADATPRSTGGWQWAVGIGVNVRVPLGQCDQHQQAIACCALGARRQRFREWEAVAPPGDGSHAEGSRQPRVYRCGLAAAGTQGSSRGVVGRRRRHCRQAGCGQSVDVGCGQQGAGTCDRVCHPSLDGAVHGDI